MTSEKENKEEKQENNSERQSWNKVRGLLKNYPKQINFHLSKNLPEIIEDIILMKDLIDYCNYKTIDDELKDLLKKVLDEFKTNKFDEILSTSIKLDSHKINFGRNEINKKLMDLIIENKKYFLDKLNFFLTIVPIKKKNDMHLETAQGFPGNMAEDFESQEMEKAQNVGEGTTFKIEEGEVIPL